MFFRRCRWVLLVSTMFLFLLTLLQGLNSALRNVSDLDKVFVREQVIETLRIPFGRPSFSSVVDERLGALFQLFVEQVAAEVDGLEGRLQRHGAPVLGKPVRLDQIILE